jgi:hypothetical protein
MLCANAMAKQRQNINKESYSIIGIMILVLAFFAMPSQAQATLGRPAFGGRLLFFSPPIVTVFVNCPALVAVQNDVGLYKGVFYFTLPPSSPKAYYNYLTPGVAVKGSYLPTPIPINCIFQPIFPSLYFGTSVR